MALNPQVIGAEMPHGFAGCYARQPDMIVNTRPAGGTANIPFGAPLVYDTDGVSVVQPVHHLPLLILWASLAQR